MTIYRYFFIYGFKVTIQEYRELHGYGRGLLDDDQFLDHTLIDTDDPDVDKEFDSWIDWLMSDGYAGVDNGRPHWNPSNSNQHKPGYSQWRTFGIDGVYEYVTRTVPHDSVLRDYYIVGYDVGEILRPAIGTSRLVSSVQPSYISNEESIALQMASSRLSIIGVPFDIITLITGYLTALTSDDYYEYRDYTSICNDLLVDPKWKTIIHPEHNTDLHPQLYIVTEDCRCCS